MRIAVFRRQFGKYLGLRGECVDGHPSSVATPSRVSFRQYLLHGFFAHLEQDAGDGRKELRLLLDTDADLLIPQVIHLGPWTLKESIGRVMEEAIRNAGKINIEIPLACDTFAAELRSSVEPLVSLLLYLCSANGEIGGDRRPANPRPVKTKKGPRLFPPDKVTTWDVGVRMGAAIRRGRAQETSIGNESDGNEHHGKRPHMRKSHWHGYWTGPKKDPDKRKFTLLWLHPILVNAENGEMPATVHPVT